MVSFTAYSHGFEIVACSLVMRPYWPLGIRKF